MQTCLVDGCDGALWAAGYCSRHYNRLRTAGTTGDGPRARKPFSDRFWSRVKKGKSSDCWPWTGKSQNAGYGYIGAGGRNEGKVLSNRAAWQLTNGEIPEGSVVRHKCNNRLCCNPSHLILGTQADNVADMWANKSGQRGNAKLSDDRVSEIRNGKRSPKELAAEYGVSSEHIKSIRRGRGWKGI